MIRRRLTTLAGLLLTWQLGVAPAPAETLAGPLNLVPLPAPELPALPQPDFPEQHSQALRLEIQLSRRRVVLFKGEKVYRVYPVAVGRAGWETPTGNFKVRQKFKDPTWVHPLRPNIVIPGGDPDNPLGRYWIGFWTDGKNWIGFHGTPNPGSVGRAVSHGCIRMYNQDIEELFPLVTLGTPVTVVR